jgi:hypothetical protein
VGQSSPKRKSSELPNTELPDLEAIICHSIADGHRLRADGHVPQVSQPSEVHSDSVV